MRLLNTSTLEFQWFADNDRPPYAIASHRWGADESTFKDFQQKRNVLGAGHTKVLGFSQLVERMNTHAGPSRALNDLGLRHRCDWLWIDTCCINKEDGAELSESINSMFRWYGDAAVCYAYLADVKPNQKFRTSALDLTRSEWFKRGWTLQELIAPRTVVFLANNWDILGHKCAYSEQVCAKVCQGYGDRLNKLLAQITGIPIDVIGMPSISHLRNIPVETKMSWTERRSTTRVEDQAYCLLGLLDVFISPIYGEGEYAWTRLMQQLEYNQSVKFPAPGVKAAKKSHMRFRLKKVKQNIVDKGRFASQTTVSAEVSEYSTVSAPEGYKGPSSMSALDSRAHSAQVPPRGPMSMSALDPRAQSAETPPRPPMSVPPPQVFALSSDTPRAPMSVPPPGTYRSYSYEASSLQYTAAAAYGQTSTQQSNQQGGASRVNRKALPMPLEHQPGNVKAKQADLVWPVMENLVLPPPGTELKHRYGSAWSFHNADGFQSVWYHELPGTSIIDERSYPVDVATFSASRRVKARFNFQPASPGQLAFDKGDVLVVLESFHEDWWRGWLHGRTGLFPRSCVDELDRSDQEDGFEKGQQELEANISTLAADEEPGLDDWERHDSRSPGAWADVQSRLVLDRVGKAVYGQEQESTRAENGSVDGGENGEEPVRPASTLVRSSIRRKPVRRSTIYPKQNPAHAEDDPQAQHGAESSDGIPDLSEEQLEALPEPLRRAFVSYRRTSQMYTELSAVMYKSPSSPQNVPQSQEKAVGPIGFIESDQSVHEEDESSSIQSEHFERAHWRESAELVKPEKLVVEVEELDDARSPVLINHKEKAGVFVKSTDVRAEPMDDQNVTIPRVVLRALLDPTAVANITETPEQTAQLASTAVEYIRSLLLADSGAAVQPIQQTTTTVEAYRLETSKFQQHVSVAETVSTAVGDSASSLDGSEEFGSIRRQGTQESWFLHGVWGESG
ncbi:hypothetical protein PRZ48_015195 [Zasmidium cellare]|uniref:SH3 domain-containing protein n=1 Tax=Zasmidium cellare TaxID=395010 RepID=A0ABR0DY37_ZASCE|nr:hypothetical protein PRZ48_015195 [Zasmidium cellare]